jgi:predicted dehydrogenase
MINVAASLGRKLRLGVIGGGAGSFIGPVHRGAALLHEQYEVTASVLSSDPQRSVANGKQLGIARAYATAEALFAGEAGHAGKIDLLAIMTPNNSHYELACRALELGIDVFCEKPLTNSLPEAQDLARRVQQQKRLFAVAYAYSGYPMVRQARAMLESGQLGELRMVQSEYIQGHLAALTASEQAGTNWHMHADIAGPSLILGDIATHSYHLAAYITGQEPQSVSADVTTLVPGREAHDYCGILARYPNQARGTFTVTQAAAGAVHGLRIRVFGTEGGLEWFQEQPDELIYRQPGAPEQRLLRGGAGLSAAAQRATHIAMGHPEGYVEAFANIYQDLAEHILARHQGVEPDPLVLWYPDINDGVRGVAFVEAALRSAQNNAGWQTLAAG